MSKLEKGVMLVKDGKGWGVIYRDNLSSQDGWVDMETAKIHNPEFAKHPVDITWSGSPNLPEMNTGKFIKVERLTTIVVQMK